MKYHVQSEAETTALAERVAHRLKGGEVLLLQGELGAGKTTFTSALAEALGVRGRIKSPTFTLMQVYRVRLKIKDLGLKFLIHCDAYRVKDAREFEEIGLMDYVGRPDTVVIVEWGEKIKPLFKKGSYSVLKFEHGKKEGERIIKQGVVV